MRLSGYFNSPALRICNTAGRRGRMVATGILLGISALAFPVMADEETIVIEPLFEYPAPPEEYEGLMERSDYLMDHFWDKFDFASSGAVDQNALNDAFGVYATALRYASREKALESIGNLIRKLKGNSTLTYQFARSAEECMYGPRALMWSDEAYLPFLKAVVADKHLSDSRKQRYAMQLDLLRRNAVGAKFPEIRLTLRDGRQKLYSPKAPLTIVEFGNPDCEDCRFSRTKLEMASDITDLVESKELEIVFIVADAVPEDQPELLGMLSSYPERWVTGICYGGDDIFDIRTTPSFYLIGRDGRIIDKNLDVTQAVDRIRLIRESTSKKKK